MLKELNDGEYSDWKYAFAYAGEPDEYGSPDLREAIPNSGVSLEPFTREDVVKIIGISEGENDGADWLCAGKLKDSRWFFLSAGCDYTGWDCLAGGQAIIAKTKRKLLQFGVSKEEKTRMNLPD
jgi:hypothetical protein